MQKQTKKPKILMIQTGGTIGQEKGLDGILRPSEKNYLDKVPEIYNLADITVQRPANIDSTNMETSHRAMLAEIIYDKHKEYDGFVIIHGTDTMVETAAALNYMIQGLGKPIVLTGSQISIFEPENDAKDNLYNAIKTATMDLGEVVIAFGDKVVRGNRAIKESADDFNAFSSPRTAPLGEIIESEIVLTKDRIKRYDGKPTLFTEFSEGVEFYQQTSGSKTKILSKYVEDEDIEGIILGGYGTGNIQDRLVPEIKKSTIFGKPVLVSTTCLKGSTEMATYEVGSAPLEAGAIPAMDMTREAATQKLMYAIGVANKTDYSEQKRLDLIKDIIHTEYSRDIIK
ncbi:MAG: asparaginase [Nanoarchaeota archaeon]|nr:asparaginase [Nanoarchaeota archaeon]